MAITTLIADANQSSREELSRILRKDRDIDVVGDARDSREAVEIARSVSPSVVVVDNSIISANSTGVVEGIQFASPSSAVIVLVDGADMDQMRNLMRAGARDCLVKPVAADDLISTVRSVHEALQKQRAPLTAGDGKVATQGKVIAVYSPQGGSGKSILATNLGVALARASATTEQKGRVALLDLNLQFGDVDLMLNLSPENTIAGLAQKGATGIDSDLVDQYLTTHEESGLRVLVAPSAPQYAESITVYTVEQVIDALRDAYQFVIIDCPSQLQDTTLAALDASTTILLLTSLDLLALNKTRTAMEMLRQLYVPEKIQVVLNRANSEGGIKLEDVEAVLGVPIRCQIPSEGRVVVNSINEGKPFILSSPDATISRRINTLALELLGSESRPSPSGGDKKKGGGIFGKWF